jgi:hypothetical protein
LNRLRSLQRIRRRYRRSLLVFHRQGLQPNFLRLFRLWNLHEFQVVHQRQVILPDGLAPYPAVSQHVSQRRSLQVSLPVNLLHLLLRFQVVFQHVGRLAVLQVNHRVIPQSHHQVHPRGILLLFHPLVQRVILHVSQAICRREFPLVHRLFFQPIVQAVLLLLIPLITPVFVRRETRHLFPVISPHLPRLPSRRATHPVIRLYIPVVCPVQVPVHDHQLYLPLSRHFGRLLVQQDTQVVSPLASRLLLHQKSPRPYQVEIPLAHPHHNPPLAPLSIHQRFPLITQLVNPPLFRQLTQHFLLLWR